MNSDLLQGFYLGEWLIEPLKGQVTGPGGTGHLPPKAVEVLLCLASEPGELLTRDELLNKVWGQGLGSSEALGHAVSDIRHALGDQADDPRFVQTLPKRGYRLVIDVVPASEHTASVIIGAHNGANSSDIGLFENLRQRGVFETALAYLIVGWLLIQIADVVFAQLHLPEWTGTFVTVLVIAGFPIAIVLSWFLEFRDGRAVVHKLSAADARKRRFSRTYISVLGSLAVAAALVFGYDRVIGLPEAEESPSAPGHSLGPVAENSIAVLPFFNLDGSDETQTFANGFVDDVITRLSRVPGLLVSSRGDSFTLPPNSASGAVRKRLRVAMYLEGSVQISDDEMRIIVQLIDSSNGFHILSRTFDRPTEDFFDVRDEVTNLTVSSLRVALPPETQQLSSASSKRPDLDAYVLYRRGIDESRKPDTPTTTGSALGWFDAALEVDPEYAAAHAGKCIVLLSMFQLNNETESVTAAETSCGKALELNPNLDIVHGALGVLYSLTGEYAESESAFLESLRINPKSVQAMAGLADVYRLQQRPDEAEKLLRSAIGLQPGNWSAYSSLGYFLYRQGRYEEAAEVYENIVAIDPGNLRGQSSIAVSHMMAGNFAAAAPAFERALAIEAHAATYSNLGLMHYYLGEYEEAAQALENAISMAPNDHLYWSNLGDVLWNSNKQDDARRAFENARSRAESALSVNANDPAILMDHAWILAMLGEKERALAVIERASVALSDDPYADYIHALIQHHYGDDGEAIRLLTQAVEKGYSTTILAAEPHLRDLRASEEFLTIVN